MKPSLLALFLSVPIAYLPLAAVAEDQGKLPCETVVGLLAGGGSADDVIRAGRAAGMSLPDATVHALGCVGEKDPEAIAAAGVAAAENLAEAQVVADAVLAVAGDNTLVINTVNFALREYIRLMPQPGVYEDEYTPTGGDEAVSPAA